jgi:ATP-binding cassette subfamily C protein
LVPQSGSISLGGRPLSGATLQRFRERLAYVAQEPFLFDDTIRRNLAWSREGVDEAEMWAALAQVDADRLVRRLHSGLDTRIGERGVMLSAGERQRLALARALLRRPAVLVLDEATNAIDIAGERVILERLAAMAGTVTILLAAHRRESLALCGSVIEFPLVRETSFGRQPPINDPAFDCVSQGGDHYQPTPAVLRDPNFTAGGQLIDS